MTSVTITTTVLTITANQLVPDYEPEPFYLNHTKYKLKFPERFIKQRDNEKFDETDFLPTPLLGPNIKRREDNHVKIWLGQEERKFI